MGYRKGESGNPKGRPKGSKNKTNESIKTWLLQFINDHREELVEGWADLEPGDKFRYFGLLLNYVIPKQQAMKADVTTEREQIVITNMSAASIETLEKIRRLGLNGVEGQPDI